VSARRSIQVPGLHHGGQPIPSASLVGPLLASGGIAGLDPETGNVPDDVANQVAVVFANIERILAAAGGSVDDIVRCTFFVRDRSAREPINDHWLQMFPDEASRPARHTLTYALAAPMLVQAELLAYINPKGTA
jgi:2-iminobutanoate/2-iminopropanoate deaminase